MFTPSKESHPNVSVSFASPYHPKESNPTTEAHKYVGIIDQPRMDSRGSNQNAPVASERSVESGNTSAYHLQETVVMNK